jgi:hypothetical protein
MAPNVQTMVAPDGKSHQNESNNPAILPRSDTPQPISRRIVTDRARLTAHTAGAIK